MNPAFCASSARIATDISAWPAFPATPVATASTTRAGSFSSRYPHRCLRGLDEDVDHAHGNPDTSFSDTELAADADALLRIVARTATRATRATRKECHLAR